MGNKTITDIATTNEDDFIAEEMKFFGKRSPTRFKKNMEGLYEQCSVCGVYYWVFCKKRCEH